LTWGAVYLKDCSLIANRLFYDLSNLGIEANLSNAFGGDDVI